MTQRILAILSAVSHAAMPALYAALNPKGDPAVAAEVDAAVEALVAGKRVVRIGQNVRLS